jgi:hypothetical protein
LAGEKIEKKNIVVHSRLRDLINGTTAISGEELRLINPSFNYKDDKNRDRIEWVEMDAKNDSLVSDIVFERLLISARTNGKH